MSINKKEMRLITTLIENNCEHALEDWYLNKGMMSRENLVWYLAGTIRGWAEASHKGPVDQIYISELNALVSHAANEFAIALGVKK